MAECSGNEPNIPDINNKNSFFNNESQRINTLILNANYETPFPVNYFKNLEEGLQQELERTQKEITYIEALQKHTAHRQRFYERATSQKATDSVMTYISNDRKDDVGRQFAYNWFMQSKLNPESSLNMSANH